MAYVNKDKFIDAIKTDWEIDFIINNVDKFHFEKSYDFNKKVYIVDLWDWRDEKTPLCIIKEEYKNKFDHLNVVLNLIISGYNKKLIDLINLINIEFETLSIDSAP